MQDPPIWQRVLAALAYLLPWSDAFSFGRGLFGLFPALQWLGVPILPIALLEQAVPFGGLVLFLVLFLAVVRNNKVPYVIRFNVLQAILIDIVVVLGALDFVGKTLSNTVFIGILVLVLFAVVQNLRGKEADIPSLSEAVRMQL